LTLSQILVILWIYYPKYAKDVIYMIKQIVVQNVLSFRDKTSVDFQDVSVIFGRNSSGKTNLLSVISFICDIASNKIAGDLDKLANSMEYRFKNGHDDILLALAFETCGYGYEIIFVLNHEKGLVSQTLKSVKQMSKGVKKQILFSTEKEEFPFLTKIERERLESYQWNQASILAVLSKEFDLSHKVFNEHIKRAFSFITQNINFFQSNSYDVSKAAKRVFNNQSLKQKIVDALKALDIPLSDIKIDKIMQPVNADNVNQENNQSVIEKELYIVNFEHKGKYIIRSFFESTGTLKLFVIFSVLLDEKNIGETWIFDEMENSLHEEIYKIFPLIVTEKMHGQVIFTSHNTGLLETNILKKRQVIIVNKTIDESSEIYPLSDFSDLRSDSRNNWQRWYRQNRFGGYPEIDFEKVVKEIDRKDNCDG